MHQVLSSCRISVITKLQTEKNAFEILKRFFFSHRRNLESDRKYGSFNDLTCGLGRPSGDEICHNLEESLKLHNVDDVVILYEQRWSEGLRACELNKEQSNLNIIYFLTFGYAVTFS